jgi:hypothetical protein
LAGRPGGVGPYRESQRHPSTISGAESD